MLYINHYLLRKMILENTKLILKNLHEDTSRYDTFIINGAIGDFLLIDSFLNDEIRSKINKIYIWNPFHPLNPKADLIKKMIIENNHYNDKIEIKTFSYPFDTGFNPENDIKFCDDLNWQRSIIIDIIIGHSLNKNKIFIQHDLFLDATKDIESLDYHKDILKKINKNSTYWNEDLCGPELKEKYPFMKGKYCVVIPFTCEYRCFNDHDINETLNILSKSLKMKGVVLSDNHININHNNIINLTTKTTINESIEIVKKANAFIGVDSFLSIIATEFINKLKIIIKTENYGLNHHFFYKNIKNIDNIIYNAVDYNKFCLNVKNNLI